ncbi:MAG: arsenate reductase [Candidatus Dadabacteria bacterium RIFCSPHIGHO2_12_FULL_53_21]|nr:MAG: arsenate reductase [Candidatus Dadabacteria bacterium RIFCSPHIGHO2_12_FULL_53_21]
MIKHRVLFVCVHNSARSQMAEELLRKIAGDRFDVESAGLEPGKLNPYAVAALREEGIDITGKETVSAFELLKQGRYYTYVITVCDETSAETCPIFPGCRERFHWSFPDPSKFTGTDEEIMKRVREVRERIREKITEWVTAVKRENKRDKLKVV